MAAKMTRRAVAWGHIICGFHPVDECGAVVGVFDRGVLEDLVWLVNAEKAQ